MIKLSKSSGKIIISEFEKGNSYWMAHKKDSEKDNFEIIKVLDMIIRNNYLKGVKYKSYHFRENKLESVEEEEKEPTKIRDWNFDDFHFYILSKEEASPHIKELIVNELKK